MKKTLRFYECEHEGDLSAYMDDVIGSGGKVIESRLDDGGETGVIVAEFTDAAWLKFTWTDAFGFLN